MINGESFAQSGLTGWKICAQKKVKKATKMCQNTIQIITFFAREKIMKLLVFTYKLQKGKDGAGRGGRKRRKGTREEEIKG